MVTAKFPTAQWFDSYGQCCECRRRPAVGMLKGLRNDQLGRMCQPCAKRNISEAQKARAKIKGENADVDLP